MRLFLLYTEIRLLGLTRLNLFFRHARTEIFAIPPVYLGWRSEYALRVHYLYDDELKFQIKVMLAQVGNIKSNTLDEVQLQDVIMDIVTGAIRSTDIAVDLYRWSEFPNFTKSQQPVTTSPLDSYTERMVCAFSRPTPTVILYRCVTQGNGIRVHVAHSYIIKPGNIAFEIL